MVDINGSSVKCVAVSVSCLNHDLIIFQFVEYFAV